MAIGTIAPYAFCPDETTVGAIVFTAMSAQSLMTAGEPDGRLSGRTVDVPERA